MEAFGYADYRGLNMKTIKDAHPLSRIEESLDALSGAKYFSLDLFQGYHQVAMAMDQDSFHFSIWIVRYNRIILWIM
jgi:hypothetical protein